MSKFSTSTPSKKTLIPNPDDSGVSIQLSEVGDQESDKMLTPSESYDGSDSDKPIDVKLEIDDLSSESGISEGSGPLSAVHKRLHDFVTERSSLLKKIAIGILVLAYFAYFGAALGFAGTKYCPYEHDVIPLVALTCVALALILMSFLWSKFGSSIHEKILVPLHKAVNNNWQCMRWFAGIVPLLGILAVIGVTVWKSPGNLVSVAGLAFFITILFLGSSAPTRVNWRPVIGGFVLQFYFAALILKWDAGYRLFSFLGEEARKFLAYTDVGSKFVFGAKFSDHIFVMQVLPVVVFFSCVITMLYHLGIMQCVISKIAFVMRATLGTTAAESLCAAGNIFVGQVN
ncbi:hypothetical protein V1264_013713 [Littorina saxatilis]|uniref:Uncharacterized protein n=1 Tax=Littorina saxatilis TaxID=31220 RepID=A0AAN9BQB4_9CAEN